MEVTSIIERIGRPGLLGLAGRVKEKACAKELRQYFSALGQGILDLHLENMSTEQKYHVVHSVKMTIGNLLRIKSSMLEAILAHHLAEAYDLGFKLQTHQIMEADKKKGPDKLGQSGKSAAEWAKEHAADLVKGVNDTTIDDIASAVSKGIEDQLGPDGTSRLVRDAVDDMEKRRADMIATTEMNRAMSQAALDKMLNLGIEYKQIILVDDACEICQANADEDPIPVDDSYPSGDDGPPFHPNCRCAVTGARPPEKE